MKTVLDSVTEALDLLDSIVDTLADFEEEIEAVFRVLKAHNSGPVDMEQSCTSTETMQISDNIRKLSRRVSGLKSRAKLIDKEGVN